MLKEVEHEKISKVILVVEDDPLVREHAVNLLIHLGYQVHHAENGPMALEVLDQHPEVDLLFTDMVMPGGMTGKQLANIAQEKYPHLKALYTTGYSEDAMPSEGKLNNNIDLLTKPYRRAQLAAKLEAVFEVG